MVLGTTNLLNNVSTHEFLNINSKTTSVGNNIKHNVTLALHPGLVSSVTCPWFGAETAYDVLFVRALVNIWQCFPALYVVTQTTNAVCNCF